MFCLINGAVWPTTFAALSIKTTLLEGKVTGATGNIWIPLIDQEFGDISAPRKMIGTS